MEHDIDQVAASVLAAVGGPGNVVANSTCMTRLRITVADSSLVDVDSLNSLDIVLGCVERGVNGIEVIFGPRTIAPVFETFSRLTSLAPGIEPVIGSRRPTTRMNVHISRATKPANAPQEQPAAAEEGLLDQLSTLLDE